MSRLTAHRWECILTGLILLSILAGCGSSSTGGTTRRLTPAVWAGSPASNPPAINDDLWKNLGVGDAIQTDSAGQAELKLAGCTGSLYVFKNSSIGVHACLKEESGSGTYVCSKEGTAWFKQVCPNYYYVDSAAGRVTVTGTTFSVTYLSKLRLMLVIVLEGRVEVQPVQNFDTGELDPQRILVEDHWFVYVQDPALPPIPGAPAPNVPLPLDQLPPFFDVLGLAPWVENITQRAELEGMALPPNWLAKPVTVAILSDGGGFKDPAIQEGVLAALDTDQILGAVFPNQEATLLSRVGGDEVDARSIKYNPDVAAQTLKGLNVVIVYPSEDSDLAELADMAAQYLITAGVGVKMAPEPGADVNNVVSQEIRVGSSVIWVERR